MFDIFVSWEAASVQAGTNGSERAAHCGAMPPRTQVVAVHAIRCESALTTSQIDKV
jgi:hypothetical protein